MKKETLIIILLILIVGVGYSQTEKGKLYIAGNTTTLFNNAKKNPDIRLENHQTTRLSIESYDFSEEVKTRDFTSSIGYFIKDEFMIGFSVFLNYRKSELEEETLFDNPWVAREKIEMTLTSKEESLMISPFVKYYMNINSSKTLKVFIVASSGIGKSINEKAESKLTTPNNTGVQGIASIIGDINSYEYSRKKWESYLISYKLGTGLSYFLNQYLSIDFMIDYHIIETSTTYEDIWTRNKYSIKGFESGVGISIYL